MMLVILMGTGMTSCEFFNDNPISPRLKVRASSMTIQVGASRKCNVSASTRARLLYASNNEAIATVDDKGIVTGVSEGDAVITVVATNQEGSELFLDESAVIAVKVVAKDAKTDEEEDELTPEQIAETQQLLNVVMTQEGARIIFSFNYDGIDYEATFEHQGEDYPLVDFTSSKSKTMSEALKLAPFTPILTTFTPSDEEVDEGDGEIKVIIEDGEETSAARKAGTRGEEKYGPEALNFLLTLLAADGSALAQLTLSPQTAKVTISGPQAAKVNNVNVLTPSGKNKTLLNVTVKKGNKNILPSEVNIFGDDIFYVGDKKELILTMLPDDASIIFIEWSSANSSVKFSKVNNRLHILVTAENACEMETINAQVRGEGNYCETVSFEIEIKERTPLESVTLKSSLTLKTGETFLLEPEFKPDTADIKSIEWRSYNSAVATVTEDGLVTAKIAGKVRILCTARDYFNNKKEAICEVTVKDPEPKDLTVKANGYSGTYDGKEHGIEVIATTPSEGGDGNVSIDYGTKEGTYDLDSSPTYKDVGEYTVYYQASYPGYKTATGSAKVVISKANAEISFKNSSETKTYGDEKFTNTLTNSGDGTVKYSSDKTSVAVVNESTGEVEIKGVGTATITATVSGAKNYQYAKDKIAYTLTVNPKGTISDYDKKDSQDW